MFGWNAKFWCWKKVTRRWEGHARIQANQFWESLGGHGVIRVSKSEFTSPNVAGDQLDAARLDSRSEGGHL